MEKRLLFVQCVMSVANRCHRTPLLLNLVYVYSLSCQVCFFVCLFVVIKPENQYSASRPGREVKTLGVYPVSIGKDQKNESLETSFCAMSHVSNE